MDKLNRDIKGTPRSNRFEECFIGTLNKIKICWWRVERRLTFITVTLKAFWRKRLDKGCRYNEGKTMGSSWELRDTVECLGRKHKEDSLDYLTE